MDDAWLRTPGGKPRARSLGIPFGGIAGRWNAITDVPGVEVGYATLIEGTDVRTGVTAIHPRGRSDPGDPCVAGYHSQNGNGEMTGVSWIHESGTMAGPICVTNTHAVGIAHGGIVKWTAKHHPAIAEAWLLPVAGETWDGYLNDINGGHVTVDTAVAALEAARSGPIEEGSVGGGTGMNCYSYKGGSTTASRVVEYGGSDYTVGVFLQANFGARAELVIAGIPVGADLADDDPMAEFFSAPVGAGSCIGIVATDAPLLPDQCRALARRVTLGLARTGTAGSHFSGDLFLGLSTANPAAITPGAKSLYGEGRGRLDQLSFIPWGFLDPFYEAVVQAVEEAVIDVLVVNDEMVGFRGHRTPGLPNERVVSLLRAKGVIS
ncbi:MAG TPA: P1 family peptidase [Candidatus Deferrimicrobium sp.]|nr:P1 family peptidase [Candidatus Deferrimicrobium sp.]